MELIWMLLMTVVLLAAAVYAQYRLPFHTVRRRNVAIGRALLIVVGLAFGYVMAAYYARAEGLAFLLTFLSGFGLVHVPAAFILFIKRQRAADTRT